MRYSLAARLLPVTVSLLMSAGPAPAHEWRAMRAEYAAEFECARMMGTLDCAGLNAYVEHQRVLTNRRIHA